MWPVYHACAYKRDVFIASVNLCFCILGNPRCVFIPALQQHRIAPASIILERYPNWPISSDNCCGSLQVAHVGHLIGPVADQVSLCDHQIGQWGIRYPRSLGHQMGHTSFVVFLLSLWQHPDGQQTASESCSHCKTSATFVLSRATLWPLLACFPGVYLFLFKKNPSLTQPRHSLYLPLLSLARTHTYETHTVHSV